MIIISTYMSVVMKCRVVMQDCACKQCATHVIEVLLHVYCRRHYKEYLVFKINQNHIDPLPLVNEIGPLQAILRRDEVNVPDQQPGEGKEQYAERLKEVNNYHVCVAS